MSPISFMLSYCKLNRRFERLPEEYEPNGVAGNPCLKIGAVPLPTVSHVPVVNGSTTFNSPFDVMLNLYVDPEYDPILSLQIDTRLPAGPAWMIPDAFTCGNSRSS